MQLRSRIALWHLLLLSEEDVDAFPGLAALTERQAHILQLAGVQDFPEVVPRSIEVKHSGDRCRPKAQASCILPAGQQYLTHKCRFMLPWESLGLQGIHVEPELTRKLSRALVQSLAGNAFETSCCLGTLCCTLVVLSRPFRRREEVIRSMPAVDQEHDGDDADESSSSESLFRVRKQRLC